MGIESLMETVIGLALFASAFALLGFVIGEMHGRPKLRRDKRTGRFVSPRPIVENYDPLFYDSEE